MTVASLPSFSSSPRCFVRLRNARADGFVEFDFAIEHPELSVDLILPVDAFEDFCAVHRVRFLTSEEGEAIDRDQAKWRYGAAGLSD